MCFRHRLCLYEYKVVLSLFLMRLIRENFKYKTSNKYTVVTAPLLYAMSQPSTSPHFLQNLSCCDLKAVRTMSDKPGGKKSSQRKT